MVASSVSILRIRYNIKTIVAFVLMALAIAWFVNMAVLAPLIPTDDAFITYRYAANFATGHGLVYNWGEQVLGTTAPGYAMLLGVIARVIGVEQLPATSRMVNGAAIVILAGCAFILAWQVAGQILVSCGVLLLVMLSPSTRVGVLSGMESPVFLALIGLSLLALVNQRWYSAAVGLGLLPLIRPEGMFVIALSGILFLAALWRRQIHITRRVLLKSLLLLLLPIIAWATFSTLYYGSPIPQSVQAKHAGVYPVQISGSAIGTISGLADNFLRLNFIESISIPTIIVLGLFLTIFLLALIWSCRWLIGKQPFLAFIPLFALVMIVFYATSGTLVFGYYHANYDIFAKIAWWAGLYVLVSKTVTHLRTRTISRRYTQVFGAVTLLIVLFPSLSILPAGIAKNNRQYSGDALRQLLYRDLAHHLRPFLPDDTTILMPEIGELGFILDHVRVLDAAGLVSPEAIPYLPIPLDQRAGPGIGAIPVEMVHDYRPDMLIFFDIFAIHGIGDDSWFWDHYTPVIVHEVDLPGWDSHALYVFVRNDFQAGLQLRAFTSSIS